jgi:O-antigen/teichoic acid export membrane protein
VSACEFKSPMPLAEERLTSVLYLTDLYSKMIAIGTLGPHASGAGNDLLVGRYLQLSMILYFILSVPPVLVWCIWTDEAVLWFGFDEETAALSQNYAYPYLFIMFLLCVDSPVYEFLGSMGHEKYSTVVSILSNATQTLSIVVAVSLGAKDLVYIGIVQAFMALVITISNMAFVINRGWLDAYWEGFAKTLSLRVSNIFESKRSQVIRTQQRLMIIPPPPNF